MSRHIQKCILVASESKCRFELTFRLASYLAFGWPQNRSNAEGHRTTGIVGAD
jgi:hypothetical protein